VTESIEALVKADFPDADVTVHIEPDDDDLSSLPVDSVIHRLALRHSIRIHGFSQGQGKHATCFFMDVEMPADWTLSRGDQVVEAFRKDVFDALNPEEVICRIEPDCRDLDPCTNEAILSKEETELKVRLILQQHSDISEVLRLELFKEDHFPTLACLCSAAPELTIQRTHQIASQLEEQIESAIHHFGKVTVILKPEQKLKEE
jgi:divalent metal cation (Fe/Co/Zn/Cd) transporter